MPGRLKDRIFIQKITNRPRLSILRAKWLKELKEKEKLGILTRFKERYTKGYNNVVITKYFLINRLYTLIELY